MTSTQLLSMLYKSTSARRPFLWRAGTFIPVFCGNVMNETAARAVIVSFYRYPLLRTPAHPILKKTPRT